MITTYHFSPTQSPQTMPDGPIGGIGESTEWYRVKLLTPVIIAAAKSYNEERTRRWKK